jgi:hypothetical protein
MSHLISPLYHARRLGRAGPGACFLRLPRPAIGPIARLLFNPLVSLKSTFGHLKGRSSGSEMPVYYPPWLTLGSPVVAIKCPCDVTLSLRELQQPGQTASGLAVGKHLNPDNAPVLRSIIMRLAKRSARR